MIVISVKHTDNCHSKKKLPSLILFYPYFSEADFCLSMCKDITLTRVIWFF